MPSNKQITMKEKIKEIEEMKAELFKVGLLSTPAEFCCFADSIATFQVKGEHLMYELNIIVDVALRNGMKLAELLNQDNIRFCDLGKYVGEGFVSRISYTPLK